VTVLLVRPLGNDRDASALAEFGLTSVIDPYLEIVPAENSGGAERLVEAVESGRATWLAVTSVNALRHWETLLAAGRLRHALAAAPNLRCIAVGDSTAAELRSLGAPNVSAPTTHTAAAALELLRDATPGVIAYPNGNLADPEFVDELALQGFEVLSEVVYETRARIEIPSTAVSMSDDVTVVLVRSPSAARAVAQLLGTDKLPVFCAGPTTATAAEVLGLTSLGTAPTPDPHDVARALAEILNKGATHD
jgi:uroporphyrinogen decarboxylase